MLEILQFVFSSFWTWPGTVVLIVTSGAAINWVIVAFRGRGVRLFG